MTASITANPLSCVARRGITGKKPARWNAQNLITYSATPQARHNRNVMRKCRRVSGRHASMTYASGRHSDCLSDPMKTRLAAVMLGGPCGLARQLDCRGNALRLVPRECEPRDVPVKDVKARSDVGKPYPRT